MGTSVVIVNLIYMSVHFIYVNFTFKKNADIYLTLPNEIYAEIFGTKYIDSYS